MTTMTAPESRVLPTVLELRDVEASKSYLEGRAVPYGAPTSVGWYTEIVEEGCFAKSIREAARGLPLLLFHDSRSLGSICGVSERWTEQADGLHGVWRLETSEEAQQAARMAENGSLGYMSVGFQPVRSITTFSDDPEDDEMTITRVEARLLEVSLTPTPAYADAAVTKVRTVERNAHRAAAAQDVEDLRRWLEAARQT
jgi:HK97 family phage prohead protease